MTWIFALIVYHGTNKSQVARGSLLIEIKLRSFLSHFSQLRLTPQDSFCSFFFSFSKCTIAVHSKIGERAEREIFAAAP